MATYLAHTSVKPAAVLADGLGEDCFELVGRLLVIDTQLSRSTLYHRLKALQDAEDPLMVSELHEVPKLKGMSPGSVAWLRSRLP